MADRALVTGGCGFVGYHLVRRLLDDGAEVVVVDDMSRGSVDVAFRALLPHVEVVEHDLTEPLSRRKVPGRFDTVFHLAAVVGVARTAGAPARVLRTNLLAAVHLLDWCRESQPGAVFLSSTSEVSDGALRAGLRPFPVDERAPFVVADLHDARSSYCLSKAAAEALFLHHADDFAVRIGRYFNVYGPRMGLAHVVPELMERARAGHDPFPVYGPHQRRSFCFVDDAVEATLRLVGLADPAPLVANIGNDTEETEIAALARRILAIAGHDPALEWRDPSPGSPDRRLPDLTALREATGYQPSVDLRSGLQRTWDWYSSDAFVPLAEHRR